MVRLDADSDARGGADLAWSLGFLSRRAIPGMERTEGTRYQVLIRTTAAPAVATLSPVGRRLEIHFEPGAPAGIERAWARRVLDLDRDLTPFQRHVAHDPVLGPLVRRRPGIRVPRLPDPFETAIRAIVGQLISVAAARTILGRLVTRFGEPNPTPGHALTHTFPPAAALASVSSGTIQTCGITRAKAESIATLAGATARGELDWATIAALPPDEADRALRSWPGIGAWTAAYVRIRGLADPDVSLATDLGIRHALAALGIDRAAAAKTIDRWRPWRSYAMMHLWASLEPIGP